MKRIFKVTVYEKITEAFDCEIAVEVPDGTDDGHLEEIMAAAIEDRRTNGDDERQFISVDDTEWDFEEVKDV